jgi:hypothetical protein
MTKQKSAKPQQNVRPRGGPARRMGEMLPTIGGTAFKRFGFVQSAIVSRWKEIVGERYARVSMPESIRFPMGKKQDGVLTVIVSGAHAPMMMHVAPEIVERTNRFFGYMAVAKVVMRQGEVVANRVKTVVAAPAPLTEAAAVELGESLKTVADPELRAVLESLARGVAAKSDMPVLGRIG